VVGNEGEKRGGSTDESRQDDLVQVGYHWESRKGLRLSVTKVRREKREKSGKGRSNQDARNTSAWSGRDAAFERGCVMKGIEHRPKPQERQKKHP